MLSPRAGLQLGRRAATASSSSAAASASSRAGTPYVWLSNQYGNTGIEFTRIGAAFNAANRIPFVADPARQPTTVTGAAAGTFTNEIDLVDPDYKYPQLLRAQPRLRPRPRRLGPRRHRGGPLRRRPLQDIDYENLNLVPTGDAAERRAADLRPRQVTTLSDVILLTNTDEGQPVDGQRQAGAAVPQRPVLHRHLPLRPAKSVNDGGSDQAASNWRLRLHPGRPEQRAARRVALRARPPHQRRPSPTTGSSRSSADLPARRLLQRPVRPALLVPVPQRRNARQQDRRTTSCSSASADQVVVTNGTLRDQLEAYIDDDAGPRQEPRPGRAAERQPRALDEQLDFSRSLGVPVAGTRKLELTRGRPERR